MVRTAPLVIEYAKRSGRPMSEAMDARLTIAPPLPSVTVAWSGVSVGRGGEGRGGEGMRGEGMRGEGRKKSCTAFVSVYFTASQVEAGRSPPPPSRLTHRLDSLLGAKEHPQNVDLVHAVHLCHSGLEYVADGRDTSVVHEAVDALRLPDDCGKGPLHALLVRDVALVRRALEPVLADRSRRLLRGPEVEVEEVDVGAGLGELLAAREADAGGAASDDSALAVKPEHRREGLEARQRKNFSIPQQPRVQREAISCF